jgi:hypothetical protein
VGSASELYAAEAGQVVGPGGAYVGRQPQLVPHLEKNIDVDVAADVLITSLAQHEFIHQGSLAAVI